MRQEEIKLMTLEQTYDDLCEQVTDLLKTHNPCDIQGNTCERGRMLGESSYCCGRCKHLTKKGCRAKSLSCKLWVCRFAYRNCNTTFKVKQQSILQEAYDHKLLYMRASRRQALDTVRGKTESEHITAADGIRCCQGKIFLYTNLMLN